MYSLLGLFSQLILICCVFETFASLADECVDTATNKTYKIDEGWTVQEQCIKYVCKKTAIPNLPNVELATLVKYMCSTPKPPDNDMRNCHTIVPYPKEPYPKCCTHMVCNRLGYQQVVKPQY